MATKEKAELEAQAAIHELEPLRTQSFQLNYAKAVDIAEQLNQSRIDGTSDRGTSRILSRRGSVIAEPRTNQIFVSDIPAHLEQVQEMLAKLDVAVQQVLIEDRKSTRLNSSHLLISYAVFCLKKKKVTRMPSYA